MLIKKLKIADLKPAEYNPRQSTKEQEAHLKASLTKFGVVEPIIVNTNPDRNNIIIGGHFRVRELKKMGEKEVDCVLLNLSLEDEKELNIRLNSNTGGWDFDALANNFDLEDLTTWGLDVAEFDIETGAADAVDDNFEVELPTKAKTVLGDLYEIGEHKLLCGDSTCSDTVAKLMGEALPNLLVTDPPYGVNYNPVWREGLEHQQVGTSSGETVLNDNNADWAKVYILFNASVLYVWHAGSNTHICAESLIGAGYDLKYLIVWNKDLMVIGRGDYHWKHETCWYAVKKGSSHNWQGDRKQTTVWDIPTIHSFKNGKNKEDWGLVDHSCQKPIKCMAIPIQNNSKQGDLIADPFLGSGSTMVASHQLKRKCYGIELDPKYCDVIIKRMLKLDPNLSIKRNGMDCNKEFEISNG
jgi:DNA modification methylase